MFATIIFSSVLVAKWPSFLFPVLVLRAGFWVLIASVPGHCILVTSCTSDEKIQVNPRFWPGLEILF